MLKNTVISSLFFVVCSVSFASSEDNQPRFKTLPGVMSLKVDFTNVQNGLGVLENLQQLNESNRSELEAMKKRLENIKKKYKSEAFDGMWESTMNAYGSGKQDAIRLDENTQRNIKRGKQDAESNGDAYDPTFDDVYICHRQRGAGSNRNYTEYKYGNHTYNLGDGWTLSSDYVDKINSARGDLSLSLYRLEKLLPAKLNSGLLMMTQSDIYREQAPTIYCSLPGGKENPTIARDKASTAAVQAKANLEMKRIPPYSESKTNQHEMVCRTLDPIVPPPFGAKCVYNYKK